MVAWDWRQGKAFCCCTALIIMFKMPHDLNIKGAMGSQLKELFLRYFPNNKRVNTDPLFNAFWKKCLRAAYYAGCILLGMTLVTGFITLTLLILASILMSVYVTSPGVAAALSIVMIGLVEWGSLATTLTGVLFLGPWLFNKTAWLFKLVPPDEPYNVVDCLRDTYHVGSKLLAPVIFLLTFIGAALFWWDTPQKASVLTKEAGTSMSDDALLEPIAPLVQQRIATESSAPTPFSSWLCCLSRKKFV